MTDRLLGLLTLLACLVATASADAAPAMAEMAEEEEAAATAETAASDPAPRPEWGHGWKPSVPNPAGWDWLLMSSGEWLKGEIVLMRDFDLQFESDEFDVVTVDWQDVEAMYTQHVYTYLLHDARTAYTGTMAMHDGRILVNDGDVILSLDRDELLSITPSSEREINLWSARISVGLSARSGNTDQADLTGRASFAREGPRTQLGLDYTGAYGILEGDTNTNNHRGNATFDVLLGRDLFVTPASFEVFSDEFQNISYRLTPGAGLGYYLVRHPDIEWQVRAGAGYQRTRFNSAFAGEDSAADDAAVLIGTFLDADITSRVDLILEYKLQLIVTDLGATNHHAQTTLELELTSFIDLDVSFIWDRIEDPSQETSGAAPKSDDFRLSVGLAIEY